MIDYDRLLHGPTMQVFGQPVVYTAAGGSPLGITGVFDRVNLQQQPLGGGAQDAPKSGSIGNVTALRTVLGVQLSQFPAPPKKGDAISVPSQNQNYTIQEVRPDGKGWALLIFTKA